MRGVIAQTKREADVAKAVVFEIAQQQGITVFVAQVVHRFVKNGADAIPVGRGFGIGEELFHGLPFVREAAVVVAQLVEGRKSRAAVEPANEGCAIRQFLRQRPGLAREIGKDALGDVASEIGRIHAPHRSRIHEVRMPCDDLAERGFVTVLGVSALQLCVRLLVHLIH